MYADVGFEPRNIGDVDVLFHDGVFHLFHLTLPNHDFIAHAVSEDGLNWKRTKNALFIGHPGAWDDDALWTMNVSADPDHEGRWRMFYTGLSRREKGRIQRIGLAVSDDLETWTKVEDGYPIDITAGSKWYESSLEEGRKWVSFRDPLFFCDGEKRLMLASGRVNEGPIIRRGCVTLLEEKGGAWEFCEPLYHPRRYDDVEVPGLFKLGGHYFLIASIREDVKVRYWYAESIDGPWRNYFDNVLLPAGNYAARTCVYPFEGQEVDEHGTPLVDGKPIDSLDVCDLDNCGRLVFNFYFTGENPGVSKRGDARNLMPPPKRLAVHPDGRLMLKSFDGFDRVVEKTLTVEELAPLKPIGGNPDSYLGSDTLDCWFGTDAGFETFLVKGTHEHFRMTGKLHLEGRGKCGIVFRLDEETTSGYYLSLDFVKGLAQLRSWEQQESPNEHIGLGENAFHFKAIQTANFLTDRNGPWDIELVAYGRYLEFSVDGYVRLTLVDDSFAKGRLGFYAETARIRVDELTVEAMHAPRDEAPALID
ncbi:MAG: glycosyl hydrolase [Planctomycetota bacterium]